MSRRLLNLLFQEGLSIRIKVIMNKIKLIIFDLDGTLVDAYRAVADSINYSLKKLGYPPQDDSAICTSVGWGEHSLLAAFVEEKDVDQMQKIYREHHRESLKYGSKFLDGAQELIKRFKREGYLLAIATNRSLWSTRIILEHLEIIEDFDSVLTKDDVERSKPHADILNKILEEFTLKSHEALYVGDMTIDVETGKNAGVKTVAVLTGSSTREEVEKLKPFKVIENVWDVTGIVEEINLEVAEEIMSD